MTFEEEKYAVVKVPVIESERGWGAKIDDYMICLTNEDAQAFVKEFNSQNNSDAVPDWYMRADSETQIVDITKKQFLKLRKEKRMWLSNLRMV